MLPQKLKEERNKRRLSQMEFSKIIGVSQQTIGSWETGRTSPDYEALNKIADYFGVSTDYLLGRDAAPVGTGSQTPSAAPKSGAKEADEQLSQKKEYIELHRLVDQLSHSDVEELLNTARFKKNKAERIREHVDDPDDF